MLATRDLSWLPDSLPLEDNDDSDSDEVSDAEEAGNDHVTPKKQEKSATQKKYLGPRIRVSKATPPTAQKTFAALSAVMLEACFLRDVRPSQAAMQTETEEEVEHKRRTESPERRRRFLLQLMREQLLSGAPTSPASEKSSSCPVLLFHSSSVPSALHHDPNASKGDEEEETSVSTFISDAFTERFESPTLPIAEALSFYQTEFTKLFGKLTLDGDAKVLKPSSWLLAPFTPIAFTDPLKRVMMDGTTAGWFQATANTIDGTVERLRWQLLDAFCACSFDSGRCRSLAAQWLLNICKKIEKRKMGLVEVVGVWRALLTG